mmetsp:Transcript_123286/g.334829  ORF Transcript_123286/g.334829 Transcript_123286/m.334829 type:complete len:201 (+) Transcript_123286:1253-1855(+)
MFLAWASSGLSGYGHTKADRSAADAGSASACTSACKGETSSRPPSTTTFFLEIVQGSCREESTSGNGSDAPSSGSISHAKSAPSTSRGSESALRLPSSPTSTGSSWRSRSACIARSLSAAATTRSMPMPQLKVAASSLHFTFPTAASQRCAAGISQASAWSLATRCSGSTPSQQRCRPPDATGAAPLSSPWRARASRVFT